MEAVVIKAMNESYSEDRDIRNLITYIAGESKKSKEIRYYGGRGVSKEPQKAAKNIIQVQKHYGKADKRRIFHFVVAFPCDMDDAGLVKIVAENIAYMFSDRYQIFYGVHEDTENLHIHFAVNTVSFVDGKKLHQSKKEFGEMKKSIEQKIRNILNCYS